MGIKIGSLPERTTLVGTEQIPVVFSGVTYRIPVSLFRNYITPASIGLGRVNNTNDAEKQISDATAEALAQKANSNHTHGVSAIQGLDDHIVTVVQAIPHIADVRVEEPEW